MDENAERGKSRPLAAYRERLLPTDRIRMKKQMSPPPAIDFARVIEYALVEEPIRWTGRQRLYVGDVLLGPVPRLVLVQNMDGPLVDVLLFHCDEDWQVLGVNGAATLADAKALAEAAYAGVTKHWMPANVTAAAAERYMRTTFPRAFCSFRDRSAGEAGRFVESQTATICADCIERLHAAMHESPTNDTLDSSSD